MAIPPRASGIALALTGRLLHDLVIWKRSCVPRCPSCHVHQCASMPRTWGVGARRYSRVLVQFVLPCTGQKVNGNEEEDYSLTIQMRKSS